jgi:hypothetical protein
VTFAVGVSDWHVLYLRIIISSRVFSNDRSAMAEKNTFGIVDSYMPEKHPGYPGTPTTV